VYPTVIKQFQISLTRENPVVRGTFQEKRGKYSKRLDDEPHAGVSAFYFKK
jgi:hypothetical protein